MLRSRLSFLFISLIILKSHLLANLIKLTQFLPRLHPILLPNMLANRLHTTNSIIMNRSDIHLPVALGEARAVDDAHLLEDCGFTGFSGAEEEEADFVVHLEGGGLVNRGEGKGRGRGGYIGDI